MSAIELVGKRQDGKEVMVWSCGTCGCVAFSKADAESCCGPCTTCGKPTSRHAGECDECRQKRQHADFDRRMEEIRAKAKRIKWDDYTGEFLVYGDQFYDEPDNIFEDCVDGDDLPTEVWGTYELRLSFDAKDLINDRLEQQEHHEDAYDSIPDGLVDELQKFLDGWCQRAKVVSYFQDDSVLVDLSAEAERWRAERRAQEAARG